MPDIYWARYYADGWKRLPGPLPENTESLRAIGFLRPFLTRQLLNTFLQDPGLFDAKTDDALDEQEDSF